MPSMGDAKLTKACFLSLRKSCHLKVETNISTVIIPQLLYLRFYNKSNNS